MDKKVRSNLSKKIMKVILLKMTKRVSSGAKNYNRSLGKTFFGIFCFEN